MCIHPKDTTTSDVNKITEELNEIYNDMDSLGEFSRYCRYLSDSKTLDSGPTDLRVLHLNVRSILPIQDDLAQFLNASDVDICTLNETWLKKQNNRFLKMKGFKCELKERSENHKGGGVGIAISNRLKYTRRTDLESKLASNELCVIKLLCHSKNILIVSLYRAPSSPCRDFVENYKTLLGLLNGEKKPYLIGTDHNFDLLKCTNHRITKEFLDSNLDNDCWPTITKPTRITKSSATLIDNIIVSASIYNAYQSGILLEDLSDHFPCILVAKNILKQTKARTPITSRKITPKTVTKIKNELSSANLSESIKSTDINTAFDKLHEKVLAVVDKIAPYETYMPGKQSYRKEPWLPISLLKSVK